MKFFAKIIVFLALASFSFSLSAQDYELTINNFKKSQVAEISHVVSIDKISDNQIIALANEREFQDFRKLGIPFEFKNYKTSTLSKSEDYFRVTNEIDEFANFDVYPSYNLYLELMSKFHSQNPDITELIEIGESVQGRKILALKIHDSDNESQNPEFLLASTIHGDEVCGYILMLRLIDYLLNNRESNEQVKNILSNTVLYICPLLNPDGTYFGGDDQINRAIRYNANNEDLNRNYPTLGPEISSPIQPETEAMINFDKNHNFVMSVTFHSGEEVINYPWDSFYEDECSLPDKSWFVENAQNYVELAREFDSYYLKSIATEGYVFGSEWYKVDGGRQDYMLYYNRCREITIEISRNKLIYGDDLDAFWQKNYRSILNYIQTSNQGIKGSVSDEYGNNLNAEIIIKNHDKNHSSVFTNKSGLFFRPFLADKKIEVCAYSEGYLTNCQEVITEKDKLVELNFLLPSGESENPSSVENILKNVDFQANTIDGKIIVKSNSVIEQIKIVNVNGQVMFLDRPDSNYAEYSASNYISGTYVIQAKIANEIKTQKLLVVK